MVDHPDPDQGPARFDWPVWGTDASIAVGRSDALTAAVALAQVVLADVTAACSRFDDMSELSRLSRDRRIVDGVDVSPLLAQLVEAAIRVAAATDGSVDPTLGNDLAAWGYDRDAALLPPVPDNSPRQGFSVSARVRESAWPRVRLDGCRLSIPAGITLDLGATAKAFAADLIAQRITDVLRARVLVSLGGDIATAGPAGSGGWEITVQDLDDDPAQQVHLPSGVCLATSSTQKRRWMHEGRPVQHILDPAFGVPVVPVWRSVSVAASTCLMANALSTAAIVRGHTAVGWLATRGADARLVDLDGRVITVGDWPEPEPGAAVPNMSGASR
ncbi:FAD:protein FMN transferase [Leifsonia poae]|uniref:FAD:protein FMN transferase n=1 Tax=Leifsonia poae TaxID=110933 RepID=A0A9W6H9P7_9MICO|nr:FAD:protein FMN transferase [Leifsonia poae]GLJ76505.1 FAD:protein FMN transferase [Leifsonia poae]